MGIVYNRRHLGLYNNGQLTDGQNGWEYERVRLYTAGSPAPLSGTACLGIGSPSVYGTTFLGEDFIPVDTSKYYQHSVSIRATENNYLGNVAGGHLGFSCYDDQYRFIDLRNCGGLGNTTLAKDLTAGDSYIYITSDTSWTNAAPTATHQHQVLLFPATHPEFSTAHEYTRIGHGDYNIYYNPRNITLTGSPPAYRLQIVTNSGSPILTTPTTFPSIGYSTPSGTPVSIGRAGGTYNYAHNAPNHTLGQWETYTTVPFTGESRNSTFPFRYGTKYIKFLNLRNYNTRNETSGSSPRYLMDNIMLVECPGGKARPSSLFNRSKASV
jgi:hypothetical protein